MAGLSDRLWPVLVFGLTLVSLLVLTPQFVAELDPPTGDEPFYLQMAQSLINDGDFEMTNNYEQRDYLDFYPKDTTSPDFRGWQSFPLELPPHNSNTLKPGLYEKHGVGLAVLIAPAYQAAGRLGPVVLMGLLAALLAANIFLLAREFSGDLKASLVATLGMAFTSPLLPYSFLIFPAVPAALLSVYAFRRARLSPGNNRLQLVGLAASLGILPWLHAGYLWISIPLLFFFLAKSRGDRRALAVVLPVVAASGGLFLYYYYDLYGTIIPNYADHAEFLFPFGTLQGMLGLLLDQQWGLLVYSPFYLVALAGIGLIFRTRRLEAIWLLLATAPAFLFFASYSQWWGEWCPPARYLAPILPLAAAPVALFLRHSDLPGRVLSGFLLAVSLLIMGGFAVAPKLMYNHPTGESQLFLALAGASGFDLTPWLPSLVNPGPGVYWQASLAVVIVAAVVAFLIGSAESKKGAGVVPGGFQALCYLWSLGRRFEEKHPRVLVALALGFILLTGAYFRFEGLDWDAGQHVHPDERFITMVANDTSLPSSVAQYFDSASSPLNPFNRNFKSYPYGTSFLFMAKFLAGPAGMEGYDRIALLGRFLSALFDLGTVALVFLLGCRGGFQTRPYNRWVGLLGAFLYATAALAIQYSHFFVAESFTTFFLVLTLFLALRISQGGSWGGYAGMGLACGLALASKVSVALVLPVMAVPAVLAYRSSRSLKPILGLALALIATFLAFRVAQPYAFAGTGFFDLRPSLQFWSNVEEQRRMAEGSLEFPYTLQWAGTIPYLFPLQNLFWGLGPAMMLAALGGTALALYQLIRERCLAHLLVLLWVGLAFVYFGGQMVKYMRYLLPVYPFLALLAAYLVVWMVERGTRNKERGEGSGVPRSLFFVPLVAVLLGSFLWALAFTQIYRQPLTRVEASQWIFQNVPQGATVAVEHWDDPLPMSVRNVEPRQYRQLFLELYNDDSPAKVDILVDQLSQADYIFISSNRLYGSISRLPLRYPMTIEYYRLLFSGELGFQREKVFASYPKLGALDLVDDAADEAFTVYDHPKVLIFRKSDAFSRERVRQLLSAVPLDNVVRQGLKDAPFNGLLMPPDLLEANRSGGTWTEIFDPQGLPASLPFPAWYLLVQVLSFAVLPLGMVALGGLPDRGYPLFKTLGVLLVSYLSWLAASLRLAPYTRVTILAAVVMLSLLSALALWRRGPQIRAALKTEWRLVLATEVLFLVAFAAFYLLRLHNPDLWHPYRGGEKPMDLAYLNAVAKSTYFPPYDPWFAGGYINYYYFGQVLVASLAKLTAIPITTSYNLAVPLFYALTVLGAFSAGYNLVAMRAGRDGLRTMDRRMALRLALAGGAAAALMVAAIGNLDGLVQLVQGLWKINPNPFDGGPPGVSGVVNGWLGLAEVFKGKSLPVFDFWRSSRLMTPAFSITEFPYFTFLLADLHAHLIVMPFTLLALGFIISLAGGATGYRTISSMTHPVSLYRTINCAVSNTPPPPMAQAAPVTSRVAQAILLPLCLGAIWLINSWDFPTYFLLAGTVILLMQCRQGWNWLAIGRAALLAAGLFLGAYLLYYPFHYYYQQFYMGVNPSPEKTPLHQYLGVHGLFILIIGGYLLSRLKEGLRRAPGGALFLAPGVVLLAGMVAALWLSGLTTTAFLAVMLALALLALLAADDRASKLVAVVIIAALAVGVGVEFITIKGDIQRMNTVFKFYLQAWVLMAVASAYCLVVLLREWLASRRWWPGYAWAALVAVALWGSLLYPIYATPVRLADRFTVLPPTDDGMAYMAVSNYADDKGDAGLASDYKAIRWMEENIPGSPVVLEANTWLYRWGSRISIYTGLPTVIGWDWHQKQQRAAYHDKVEARLTDVRTMYTTTDAATLLRLLKKYSVSYIYVGQTERNYYPAPGIAKFDALDGAALRRVYQEGPVSIYRVVQIDSRSPGTIAQ